ncbi:MAG TPA: VOC family protein [Levilinea sp.]|nr:VOC family protein [Levilinea sp.]
MKNRADVRTGQTIHPETRLGAVELAVMDVNRQVSFHKEVLGMTLHWQQDHRAGMGAGGEDILRFVERKDAVQVRRTTGLYHTAILLPSKRDLAQLLMRIHEKRSPLQGMSDHGTHLAIYLPDAEGNGIELAWDRPKAQWPDLAAIMKEGDPAGMRRLTAPLDIAELLSEAQNRRSAWEGMSAGTKVGHVHLHVSDLKATRHFYHGLLGFDITLDSDPFGMVFFSAGGYHHHLGANIWNGAGAPPPPANSAGLRSFTIVLPEIAHLEALVSRVREAGQEIERNEDGYLLRDPSGNGIRLIATLVNP